jgi:hypothetical protein
MSSDAEDAVEDLHAEAVVVQPQVAENSLINLVLVNRLQRNAKSVSIAAFELCLATASLFWQIDDSSANKWVFWPLILFSFITGVQYFRYIFTMPSTLKTSIAVEKAYKANTKWPLIDDIQDIQVARKFGYGCAAFYIALINWIFLSVVCFVDSCTIIAH